jgi:hypothetical protein
VPVCAPRGEECVASKLSNSAKVFAKQTLCCLSQKDATPRWRGTKSAYIEFRSRKYAKQTLCSIHIKCGRLQTQRTDRKQVI